MYQLLASVVAFDQLIETTKELLLL